jgi:DNA-directed RNA polymerase subunit M/transcription elongation factor TFIIS
MSQRKVQKRLNKRCPECSDVLEIVSYTEKNENVQFTKRYRECHSCGYKEEIRNKADHKRDDFEPSTDW